MATDGSSMTHLHTVNSVVHDHYILIATRIYGCLRLERNWFVCRREVGNIYDLHAVVICAVAMSSSLPNCNDRPFVFARQLANDQILLILPHS